MENQIAQDTLIPEVIPDEIIDNLPKMTPQMHGYSILREQGLSPGQAGQAVGYTRQNGYLLEKKFDKYKITGNAKLLKLAHNNLKNMLEDDSTKDSVKLGCINTVMDRNDPVVRINHTTQVNVNLTPVDISRWKR